MLALLCAWALAADTPQQPTDVPHLWVRGFSAVALNPTGVLIDGAAEFRAPVMRYGGAAFNNTFVGAGMRFAVSPVHADLVARVSFQPIDVLPITVEGFWGNYWESPWGPVPADRVEDMQLRRDRKDLYDADRDFVARTLGINLIPTFQIQYGKVAGFTSWTFTFMQAGPRQQPEPWWFDSYRGMVLDYRERVIEHTSAVVWEFKNGKENTSILRAGAMLRGKFAKNTTDATLTVGGVVMWRPGKTDTAPTALLMVAPYLQDPDFNPGIPYILLMISANRAIPLRKLGQLP